LVNLESASQLSYAAILDTKYPKAIVPNKYHSPVPGTHSSSLKGRSETTL